MGMCQATQHATFSLEPLLAALPHERDIKDFHRDAPLEPSVVSLGHPHSTHSPMAERRNERVDSNSLASQTGGSRQFGRLPIEKTFLRQGAMLLKEYFELARQCR